MNLLSLRDPDNKLSGPPKIARSYPANLRLTTQKCLKLLRAPVDKPQLTRFAFRRTIPTDRTAGGPSLRSIDEMEVVS